MRYAEYINGVLTYRDATLKEIEELEVIEDNHPDPEPTPEELLESVEKRTDALETTTDDMILLMADLIGGN